MKSPRSIDDYVEDDGLIAVARFATDACFIARRDHSTR
jgi:hypothetical protein